MAESTNSKDVIYIDAEEEITGLIDKVRSTQHQIVALVLPKRASLLQSIVNMKLLKRSADEAKKHVVLITSEEGLLPLAGSVGMHVARNLQTRPEIPPAPPKPGHDVDDVEESVSMKEDHETSLDKTKPIGELAGLPAADEGPIELDNSEGPKLAESAKAAKQAAKGKNKKLRVPNFNKFRSWLFLGGIAVVVFVLLLYVCLSVLPRATVTVDTNSQTINATVPVTLSTSATSVNTGAQVVPAQVAQTQKTFTGQANATGQQNNGQKASGSVVFYDCDKNDIQQGVSETVPAGVGISAGGNTYITQQSVTVPPSNFDKNGNCKNNNPSGQVQVIAQSAGAGSNTSSNTSFSVNFANPNGDGTNSFSAVSASGMSGGTDNITQIVQQADIDNAKSKINPDSNPVKAQLQSDLQSEGLYPIPATFTAGTPTVSNSTNAGSAASSVTVTEGITYTMLGAHQSDLDQIIDSSVSGQISSSSQKILNDGLGSATITSQNPNSGSAAVSIQTGVLVGSALDQATIKKQVAGAKPASAETTIRNYPGVTNVRVSLSPFWVTGIPKNTSKITVKIVNPN
ncbi:MAG TPA: hypothetical protein VGS08_00015 [Candidatus Saccharimonadales bacterium]|nr:hypothetical protein [Candidatus Saccharimonadales bacterium]